MPDHLTTTIDHADYPVYESGYRLAAKAEAILARRNSVRGRAPDDYDSAEYLEALREAEIKLSAPPEQAPVPPVRWAIQAVLGEVGFATASVEGEEKLVFERAHTILAEQGISVGYTDEDLMHATRLAIHELDGDQLGELAVRAGLQPRPLDVAETEKLIDDAVGAGVILANQRTAYRTLLRADPGTAVRLVR